MVIVRNRIYQIVGSIHGSLQEVMISQEGVQNRQAPHIG